MRCVGVAVFSGHTMACPYKGLLTYTSPLRVLTPSWLPRYRGRTTFQKEENLRNCPYKVGIGDINSLALSTQHS